MKKKEVKKFFDKDVMDNLSEATKRPSALELIAQLREALINEYGKVPFVLELELDDVEKMLKEREKAKEYLEK